MDPKPPSTPQSNAETILKRSIEAVENSNLHVEEKLALVLFLLDRKPGVQLGGYKVAQQEEDKRETMKEFSTQLAFILQFFGEQKIPHRVVKDLSDEDGVISFSVLGAKNQKILDEFTEADKKEDEKTFGSIVGYPKTATEALQTDKMFQFRNELPPEEVAKLRAEGVAPFFRFIPSRDHWEDELEFVRQQQKLIREKAPKLYEEVIRTLK